MAGLSVLAHTHTPPVDLFTSRGQGERGIWGGGILPFCQSTHGDTRSLPLTRGLGLFYSRSELGSRFLSPTNFLWMSHSWFLLWVCVFLTGFVVCVYVFPPVHAENLIFSLILRAVYFPVASMLRSGLMFSPQFVAWCGFLFVWFAMDSYWVVLAMIGPRTTQGLDFPVQAVNCLFCCMYAVVGLQTVLEWGWGLDLLDKPGVFGSHTDRARGLAFFSTTPE